jgi:hypothetical protein
MMMNPPSALSDIELTAEVRRLARGARETTVTLIGHLMEFDTRRLYLGAGFGSLFAYCTEVLRLSEEETCNRIQAARAARSFPVILEMLSEGALNLTTVRMLAKHLTAENHRELLAEASGKSKHEVEKLLARRFPQPDTPASVRRLPPPRPMPAPPAPPSNGANAAAADAASKGSITLVAAPPSSRRFLPRPLSPDRYEIRFTASASSYERLRFARDLLADAVPSGDMAEIFDRALALLVRDLARKKFAATERPRESRGQSEDSRNIPAAVQREVWDRDGGRCAFVANEGHRCNQGRHLQYHHAKRPYATGGPPTVDNLQLRCRAHNAYEADLYYGPTRRFSGDDVVKEASVPYRPFIERQSVPERIGCLREAASEG